MVSFEHTDTIFALATPPGRSALAVIRVSGVSCRDLLLSLIGKLPEPRRTVLAKLREPGTDRVLDAAVITWFPGPKSFTGEDCFELSVHGSKAVVHKILEVLGHHAKTRIAQPGEFTRRALENGKMDLIEVEALADLISAETEQQRRLGIAGLSGRLQDTVACWRELLIDALVEVESSLDFADEHEVETYDHKIVRERCMTIVRAIDDWSAIEGKSRLLREGFTVLISGPPNAGKSTLMNEMARREIAIVTDLPGTTRDLLEVRLDLNGYLINLVDSAGVREASDVVEAIGIQRTFESARSANLVLWLCDHREITPPPPEFDEVTLWRVYTKCDRGQEDSVGLEPNGQRISVKTGHNVQALLDRLFDHVSKNISDGNDDIVINARQRSILERAKTSLLAAATEVRYPEIVATGLREAAHELEILIGRIGVEDILGEIFSRFCIGK